jgi:hypothetical protein
MAQTAQNAGWPIQRIKPGPKNVRSRMDEKKALCLNCVDGHIQLPVIHWIIGTHNVEYVDMITEPGIAEVLADPDNPVEAIKRKIRHSLVSQDGTKLFIVGHADCDFHTTDHAGQKDNVRSATARMKKEFPDVEIHGLWFKSDNAVEILREDLS